MLNPIILYQNVSCATGIDYLAGMGKKSGDYSGILRYTNVMCDYRKYHLM